MGYELDRGTTPLEGLLGLAATVAGVNVQNKANQKTGEQNAARQKMLDDRALALQQAQIANWGSEDTYRTTQGNLDKSNITKNNAATLASGTDPATGKRVQVDMSGIQLQPHNHGKKTPVTLQQQLDAATTAFQRYAKATGATDQRNPFYMHVKGLQDAVKAHDTAQAAAQAAAIRFVRDKALKKDTPTYADLHPKAREKAAEDTGSQGDFNTVDAALGQGGPNGVHDARTAAKKGAQLEAMAIYHGHKANSPLVQYIRARTQAKIQGYGGLSTGGGGIGAQPQ